jgi:hypothetical protein
METFIFHKISQKKSHATELINLRRHAVNFRVDFFPVLLCARLIAQYALELCAA